LQILKQIWESVSQKYIISWLEVLEFRENHVGTPEQAIRALNYRFLEKVHQNCTKVDSYKDYYSQQTGIDVVPLHPYHHIVHTNYNATMPSTCQTVYRHIEDTTNMTVPTNYRYYQPINHGFINCCTSYGCLPSHGNKFYGNSVQPNPYCTTLPAYAARVPTGRLIELDVSASVANYEKTHALRKSMSRISDLDEVDFYKRQSSDGDHYEHSKTDRKIAIEKSRSNSSAGRDGYDTWDFVYKNLESLGYYKDLDDRDNVLQHKELDSIRAKHKTFRQAENEDKYNAHKLEKKRNSGRIEANEIDSSETNDKNYQDILPFKKKSSSFDLSDSNRYTDAYNRDKKRNSQTLPIPRTHKSSDQIAKIADSFKNFDIAQMSKQKKENDEDEKRWNCATCTYLNMPDRDICEMCAKSRCKGNEDKPLASGGKECPKCTLVNEKNVSICDACHTSLKDSPTYI